MAAINRRIAQQLAQQLDLPNVPVAWIRRGLRDGSIRRLGKPIDFAGHIETAKQLASGAVGQFAARVGSVDEVDQFVIVGGAAALFQQAISSRFGGADVHTLSDSQMVNAQGFLLCCK
jgi:hypothetical protein